MIENTIWYVEVRRPNGDVASSGSAVAVWLKKTDLDQDKRFLITCAHVVRDNASDDRKSNYGPMLTDIRVWSPESGYSDEFTMPARVVHSGQTRSGKILCEQLSREDREVFANDWVLLEVEDDRFRGIRAVDIWGEPECNTHELRIIGYPGGEKLIRNKKGRVIPQVREDFKIDQIDNNGILSILGPDETRSGMSGGGLFGPKGEWLER